MTALKLNSRYSNFITKTAQKFYFDQVNHLSHMLLTLELLPLLLDTAAESGDGRIIFVSSSAHNMVDPFDANRLNRTEDDYGRLKAYSNTKLYNVRGLTPQILRQKYCVSFFAYRS